MVSNLQVYKFDLQPGSLTVQVAGEAATSHTENIHTL